MDSGSGAGMTRDLGRAVLEPPLQEGIDSRLGGRNARVGVDSGVELETHWECLAIK